MTRVSVSSVPAPGLQTLDRSTHLMDNRHEDEDVDVTEDTAVDAPSTGDDKLDECLKASWTAIKA